MSCRPAFTVCSGGTRPIGYPTLRRASAQRSRPISAVPAFGPPTEMWFPWTRTYQRHEWLNQLMFTERSHRPRTSNPRPSVPEAIGAAIDDHGGSFVMNFETLLITATRVDQPLPGDTFALPSSGQ